MAYRIYYSKEHKKFRYDKEESQMRNVPKDSTEHWYPNITDAMNAADNKNRSDLDDIVICKQCGEPFMQTAKDRDWYAERCLDLPRRCSTCRKTQKDVSKKA